MSGRVDQYRVGRQTGDYNASTDLDEEAVAALDNLAVTAQRLGPLAKAEQPKRGRLPITSKALI